MLLPQKICNDYGVRKILTFQQAGYIVRKAGFEAAYKAGIREIEAADNWVLSPQGRAEVQKLLIVSAWVDGGKQIYRFDTSLTEILKEQKVDDMSVDPAVIEMLPCMNFYVEAKVGKFDGFFVMIDGEGVICSEDGHTISILTVNKNAEADIFTVECKNGKTIAEVMREDLKKFHGIKPPQGMISEVVPYLQIILYLAAVNAEIKPVTRYAIVKKGNYTPPRNPSPQVAEVGYRFGTAYRKQQADTRTVYVSTGGGKSKTPHIRRSHYHHFWTGSGDKKKLVLKWVNTIFVNGGKSDTAVIHEVE